MLSFFRFRFRVFAEIRRLSLPRAGKDNSMSVFLLSFSLFVLLAGIFALRDIVYARQVASNGKETEILP
jgi:Na+-driven multidrug efflux pump